MSLSRGQNIYNFVKNEPTIQIDSLGLTIWVCTRLVEDWYLRPAQHAYFWNDKTSKACGRQGKLGHGPNSNQHDTGPNTPGQNCVKVAGSEGQEQAVMDCCAANANSGPWIPFFTDCHVKVDDCLSANGLKSPPHNYFNREGGYTYDGSEGPLW
jgi:hypothetical protein